MCRAARRAPPLARRRRLDQREQRPACGRARRSRCPRPATRSMPCLSAIRRTTGEWKPERSRLAVARRRAAAAAAAASARRCSSGWASPGRAPASISASGVPTVDRVARLDQDASPGGPLAGDGISTSILSVVTSADRLVGLDPVAGPLAPLDDRALGDRDAHLGHHDLSELSVSVGEELTARLLHVVELGQDRLLERRAERDRHVGRGQPPHRRVEVLERLARRSARRPRRRPRTSASPRARPAPCRSCERWRGSPRESSGQSVRRSITSMSSSSSSAACERQVDARAVGDHASARRPRARSAPRRAGRRTRPRAPRP